LALALLSHLAERARAAAETIGLDAYLLEHANEEIRERLVILAVESHMTRMLETTPGQEDRQVVT
jgi:hypothetical protein